MVGSNSTLKCFAAAVAVALLFGIEVAEARDQGTENVHLGQSQPVARPNEKTDFLAALSFTGLGSATDGLR